jgi:hypothetical protein
MEQPVMRRSSSAAESSKGSLVATVSVPLSGPIDDAETDENLVEALAAGALFDERAVEVRGGQEAALEKKGAKAHGRIIREDQPG